MEPRYQCRVVSAAGVEGVENATDDRGAAEEYCRQAVADDCRSATVIRCQGGAVISRWDAEELRRWEIEQVRPFDDGPAPRYAIRVTDSNGDGLWLAELDSRRVAESVCRLQIVNRNARAGSVRLAQDRTTVIALWNREEVKLALSVSDQTATVLVNEIMTTTEEAS
jgi:hypothetical protein